MGFLDYSLMFAMVALYAFQSFFCKKFTLSYPGDEKNTTPVFTIFGGVVVALVTFCIFSKFTFNAHILTVGLGIANAFALYFYNFFMIKASACGPYSVLIVFSIVGDIVIPALVKYVGFNQGMTGPAILFLILIIVSVYLMSVKPKDNAENDKVSFKFILFSLGLGLSNGTYGSILAVHAEQSFGEAEKDELIVVTFLAAAIISLITLLCNRTSLACAFKQTKKSMAFLSVYALIAAFAINSLVVLMLLEINTGVLYTVQNAGVMLMSVALSMIFFKEKLSKAGTVGCVLMTIGLVGIMAFANITFSDILSWIK